MSLRRAISSALAVLAAIAAAPQPSVAITIELKDVAADRIERQRANVEGRLPLPRTPDLSRLTERLAAAGVKSGAPMMMRIFKATSELEVWLEKGDTYVLFATYPICHWSGTLGPKLREGDKQTPEGFYTLTNRQLHHLGRWPRAMNLGFPNAYDRAHNRDGSYILMHGGCSSVGCFAMTNAVIAEVYGLAKAALKGEQRYIPVHVFPFRPTDEAIAAQTESPWHDFWSSLKAAYASFDRTRRPPRISVCEGSYRVEDALPKGSNVAAQPTDKRRGKSHSDIVLGAIRTGCPSPPAVMTASGGQDGGSAASARTDKGSEVARTR